LIVVLII